MNPWPKVIPPIDEQTKRICDEFMEAWHKKLGGRLGFIDRFNHSFVIRNSPSDWKRTLDLGAGLGEHFAKEALPDEKIENYEMVEFRENMAEGIRERFPKAKVLVADCQNRLPYSDGYFDRILAIHVLEHLPRLPHCLDEVGRLLCKSKGKFIVLIPCEGGALYTLARRCSAQRLFERTYKLPYEVFIKREHINLADEVIAEIRKRFLINKKSFFPLAVPFVPLNLFIGLVCSSKA